MLSTRFALPLVLVVYSALAFQYAVWTPLWQVPDEPAHFNYIAQVSDDTLAPPVMSESDYPYEYLEKLKADRFPPDASIAGISYEDHQPPLYYYLMSLPYRVFGPTVHGRVGSIRLLGALLGALTVCLSWATVKAVRPGDEVVAIGTAAFVAFLPMNLAMTAAVNNDPLAHLIVAAALYLSVRRATRRVSASRFNVLGGALFGLALLTKTTVYLPAAAALLVGSVAAERSSRVSSLPSARVILSALTPVLIGVVISAAWFARNSLEYGLFDPLGLAAHEAAVRGQPRTVDFIRETGLRHYSGRLASFTFDSFWGVFGWMGVFLDRRIYLALGLTSGSALVGFLGYTRSLASPAAGPRTREKRALLPLAAAVVAVAAAYVWYNLSFVQHQGRYFFPALIPIAFGFAIGLKQLGLWAALGLDRVVPGNRRIFDRWLSAAAVLGFVVALALLAVLSLYRYVVPGLSWHPPPPA